MPSRRSSVCFAQYAGSSAKGALVTLAAALFALIGMAQIAHAEDTIKVNGRVYAADGKTPLADAEVTLLDDKDKAVVAGKTDAAGQYALVVPRKYLHLPAGHKGGGFGGFLGGLVGGLATEVVGIVNPFAGLGLEVAQGLAGSMRRSGASQADIARMSAGRVTQEDADRLIAAGANKRDVERMLKYSAENFDAEGNFMPHKNSVGALGLKVTQAGHKDAGGIGQIYWMESDKVLAENGREKRETNAWIDPVVLADEAGDTQSRFTRGYFTLTAAHLDPAVVEGVAPITLSVTLSVPPEQSGVPLTVIARHSKMGTIYEMTPMGEPGVYQCLIVVDKRFPKKDQLLSILAYPRTSDKPGRDMRVEKAIEAAQAWKLDRPYVYNPLLLASRNRADVLLTVEKAAK